MSRRLAAILSYDAVGYSLAMSRDEAGTLDSLKSHRREIIDPKANLHGGRTIKLQFDGVTSRLIFVGMGRDEFAVEDAGGQVEVSEAVCDGAAVLLKLSRPLRGRARVHGAYGIDPAWTLVDYVTSSPALAFHGLKVQ